MKITDHSLCKRYVSTAQSAASRGKAFELSFAEFKSLFRRNRCPYSGVIMTNDGGPDDITIDRVDNSLGYVAGNVIACSYIANQKKANLSEDMILNMAKVILKHRSKKNGRASV